MTFESLRLRLLATAGLAILAALAIAGIGLTYMFERHIERREALSLQAKARELLSGLRIDAQGRPHVDIYPSDNRFNRPAGGLYWQVSTLKGSVHSPSLWDQSLTIPLRAPNTSWSVTRSAGPYAHGILTIARVVRPDTTDRIVLVQLAGDDDALLESRKEFGRELIGSLALLWVALMVAAYVQVGLGLKPLARIRDDLERLRRSPGARLDARYLTEIRPLTDAINALADARASDLSRARSRASDLAHSLKTPLAALAAQSRRAREAGAVDAADGIDRTIAAAGAALESELGRARAALSRNQDVAVKARVIDVVDNVLTVIERTDAGERTIINVDVPEDLEVPIDPRDLTEILGALIENAVRHARSQIAISGYADPDCACISVADDGPGLSDARATLALKRGERMDESGPGHGFGLSIVRDHIEATEGEIELNTAALGGLEVNICWPTG